MGAFLDRIDEKDQTVATPGPYTDPSNPDASGFRLVTLDEPHAELAAKHLAEDYAGSPEMAFKGEVPEGFGTQGISEDDVKNMTVEELDTLAEEWGLDEYPKSAKKDEKVQYLLDNANV